MEQDVMEENLEAACHLIDDEAHRTRRPGGLDPPSSHEQPDPPSSHEQPQSRPLPFFLPNANQQESQQKHPGNQFLPSSPDPGTSSLLPQFHYNQSALTAQAIRQMVSQLAHMPDDYLLAQQGVETGAK